MYNLLKSLHNNAEKHCINTESKLILFSDCHRGTNNFADDFTHNEKLYNHALNHYLENDYTYYELGDGIELWENKKFSSIFNAHKESFLLLQKFYLKNRLHFLWGNHDMVFKNKRTVKKLLYYYKDTVTSEEKELFKDIQYQEAIVLEVEGFSKNILLIHGHQVDYFNYYFWKMSRFLVRYLWTPLQTLGVKDPTSPAKNHKELIKVERRLKKWIQKNKQMLIAGHTHRPKFPKPNEIPYFNDGSCVHPNSITGIEIESLQISLVQWHEIKTEKGVEIVKTILEKPVGLALYLKE